MLFMTYDDQPVLRCAVCEKPIMLSAEAAVAYPRGIEPGEMHRVSLAHKGACLKKAVAQLANPHGHGLTMELLEYGDRLRGLHKQSV